MTVSSPEWRASYRRGVRDAYESLFLHARPSQLRALEQWLRDLDAWHADEPPPAPPPAWPDS